MQRMPNILNVKPFENAPRFKLTMMDGWEMVNFSMTKIFTTDT